jgi:hypothetical protein
MGTTSLLFVLILRKFAYNYELSYTCTSILLGSNDCILSLVLQDIWTLYIVQYSEQKTFQNVDLFLNSGEKLKRCFYKL